MNDGILILVLSAASLGFIHTILGPDHYIPFIAMSRASGWSLKKSMLITFLCGIGHVLSSVVIGLIGIAFGIALSTVEIIESARGDVAGWLLTGFGLVYTVWGIRKIFRYKPHTHVHVHEDGEVHAHEHGHTDSHTHVHEAKKGNKLTPWVLFTIFIFGPCEVLIPLLMYPAAVHNTTGIFLVAAVFGTATIGTMMAVVAATVSGLQFVKAGFLEKYTHAIAGSVILLCGISIQFLGL